MKLSHTAIDRHREQLAQLQARRSVLVTEHEAAVAAGDDGAAGAAYGGIEIADADIRAAQAALSVAERQETAAKVEAAAAELRRLEGIRDEAEETCVQAGTAFERAVEAIAPLWLAYLAAADDFRQKATACRTGEMVPGGVAPATVWSLPLRRMVGAVNAKCLNRAPWTLPDGGAARLNSTPTVAALYERVRQDPACRRGAKPSIPQPQTEEV